MRSWLIEMRKEKGFLGSEVARHAGVSQAEYSRIENGKRTPRPKAAKLIAGLLGFDWTLLFDEDKVG